MTSEIFFISGIDIDSVNQKLICPGFANRLRPKADFGASRGHAAAVGSICRALSGKEALDIRGSTTDFEKAEFKNGTGSPAIA